MNKTKKELIEELQDHLRKIKIDNKLDVKEFEKIICIATNNVSREFTNFS